MGAGIGSCDESGAFLDVSLAAGTYDVENLHVIDANVAGESRDETVLVGSVVGLRTGSSLSSLTIRGPDVGRASCALRRSGAGHVSVACGVSIR